MKITSRSPARQYIVTGLIVVCVIAVIGIARALSPSEEPGNASGTIIVRTERTELVETPFRSVTRPDPAAPLGRRTLVTPGKNGVTKVTYTVLMAGKRETNRIKKAEEVLYAPTDEVISEGTKKSP